MKLKSVLLCVKATVCSGICLGLLTVQTVSASGKPYKTFTVANTGTGEEDPLKKNKEKNKSIFSGNNKAVKISLDKPKKKGHIIKAKENKGKEVDFFVFDLEGTLVHNNKMKMKDHYRITNLAKGIYIYRVFCGDEETASGQFEIK